jgi:hypothetical protein
MSSKRSGSDALPRLSVALNNSAERKVATWYRVMLALCVMSLYTAFTQTSYYNVTTTSISSYVSDFSLDLPTILSQLQGNPTEKQQDHNDHKPIVRYPNVAPLIPDKNNPIYTVVLPPGETTSESLHVFNDGIEQSPFLKREEELSEFHLPSHAINTTLHNQTNLIWIINGYATWRHESGHICDVVERKIRTAMAERRQQGLPGCCWHIFIIDYTDHASPQCRCEKVEELMGRDFVHNAKRSIVKGRGWNETSQWIDNGFIVDNIVFSIPDNDTVLGDQIQVRHVSYPVRTDLLRNFEQELQTRNNSQGGPISLSDPIESILDRPLDVIHLWNLGRNDTQRFINNRYRSKFRWRISSILTEFVEQHNYTGFIGVAGNKDERGRRSVHLDYVRKLLDSKLTVVTQQDGWEDHYRLMEAMISGTMIITDRMLSLPEGYEDGVSIVLFSSPLELKEKIKYYAASENALERQKIAAAGRRLALQSHRSWHVLEKVIFGHAQTDCSTVNNPNCPYMVDVAPKRVEEANDQPAEVPKAFEKETTSKTEENVERNRQLTLRTDVAVANLEPSTKIIKETHKSRPGYLLGNRKLCRALSTQHSTDNISPYSIHFMANDCGTLGSHSFGNYLSRLYLMRLLAGSNGVTLSGSCASNQVMKWIPTQQIEPNRTAIDGNFAWENLCKSCFDPTHVLDGNPCIYPHEGNRNTSGLYHIIPTIQNDMQTLLNGVLSEKAFEIDDFIIHVRLGDVMLKSNDLYGVVKYHSYVEHIPPDVKSIGIVTAPFDQQRKGSNNNATLNQAVVENLHSYLMERFPSTNITIRNNESDSTDIVFGRLVGAKTLFCGPSTFCLIPALGRTGETIVVQSPLYGGNTGWLGKVAKRYENFRYVPGSIIGSNVMHNSTIEEILSYLMDGEDR